MSISMFDLFSIGIGPSSSHTVGPMRAANRFLQYIQDARLLTTAHRIVIILYGSLAFTGKGHGTDKAILMGLLGETPEHVEPALVTCKLDHVLAHNELILGHKTLAFNYENDLIFEYREQLPLHTNGMRFELKDTDGNTLISKDYYSIGGGFVVEEEAASNLHSPAFQIPYPFHNAKTLLSLCEEHQLSIAELMLANESIWHTRENIEVRLLQIADVMADAIKRGTEAVGVLPGGLNVPRRAPSLHQKLCVKGKPYSYEHSDSMAWLNLFAIAVNEENAAGGRIVTAPTNGAAGIIPAVLYYYLNFYPEAKREDIVPFLLTAGAIAILYKTGASISGAEVGCQGEVGVACSMAAAALTACLDGTLAQIENAAEIAMEHHLGMTCDPIQGLVQIPCIERNAMGAVKAVNAARLALLGDGSHHVTLDKVIATMKQTGKDMMEIYKETSLGGLAANLPEC